MEDTMKRLIGIAALCLLMATVGMTIGVAVQPAVVVAATSRDSRVITGTVELTEPPLADGAPLEYLTISPHGQAPALAPAAVAVYTRNYSGSEFRPNDSDLTFAATAAGLYATSVTAGGNSFRRPLDLPNGAQIVQITAYFIDQNPTSNMTLELVRHNPSAGTAQVYLDTLTSTGSSASVQTIVSTPSPVVTIDNALNAYALRYQPAITGTSHILVGAKVEFSVPTAYLPFVMRQ
jgi:hypothetical protein